VPVDGSSQLPERHGFPKEEPMQKREAIRCSRHSKNASEQKRGFLLRSLAAKAPRAIGMKDILPEG